MEQQKLSFVDVILHKAYVYQKECLVGAGALFAIGALVIGFAVGGPSYRDFVKTQEAFAKWEASPENTQLFEGLSHALKKTPTMIDRYDAEIAQKLIEANLSEKALPHALRSIERLQKEFPLYASFAQTTLLIERKFYQEALENAMGLKEQIGMDDPTLYAHNLLRIAILQQALQNGPGEMAAWVDFEEFLGWREGPTGTPLSQEMLHSYCTNEIDLNHYIAERKVLLIKD